MYTISDLQGQFTIEGAIKVLRYHDDAPVGEEYETCWETECGNAYQIPEEFKNVHITYMYAKDDYLIIEIELEKENE